MQNHYPKNIFIIGANSVIAEKTALLLARQKECHFYLVGRTRKKLEQLAKQLKTNGAQRVEYMIMDINYFHNHKSLLTRGWHTLKTIDLLFIAHGTLSDQKKCENDFEITRKEFDNNLLSIVSLLTFAANRFEEQKNGSIVVIGSIAGDRGRQSNYIYGTAKGALEIFLQGLRNRLHPHQIHVLTVKPGFVSTPMTAHLQQGYLYARPENVAKSIVKAIQKKKDIVYVPFFWNLIMLGIKLIPERLFKRLRL